VFSAAVDDIDKKLNLIDTQICSENIRCSCYYYR